MNVWLIAIGTLLVAGCLGGALMVRSHRAWVSRQTPVGVWSTTTADGDDVFMRFEGGPHEGTYGQITKSRAGSERELGHWATAGRDMRLLIMASDRTGHPRFGIDTSYEISYTGPDEITVSGPDRPRFVFHRAPDSTVVPTFDQP